MQGVGNDFVVVDGRAFHHLDWSGLAREMCDRRFGVGADGLLVIDRSRVADAMMRMHNPDGTPDVCGNGLRCVARYLVESTGDWATSRRAGAAPSAGCETQYAVHHTQHALTIATLAGVREATVTYDARGECWVTVEMGQPRFAPEEIPMLVPGKRVVDYPLRVGEETLNVTALSTGTTHTVLFVEALPDEERFRRLSPLIENHPLFPERTSLMWTQIESPQRLRLRIWERGAGETWGCGTGACAAAVAARLRDRTEETVTVASKGGELIISWRAGEPIRMTGPAVYVYKGLYPLDSEGGAA